MTNKHAGNEWFRRLVSSNRPLYRSCPKHTKLLVAKAIVQAVQQQEPPGRFLEAPDKESGTWRQITYKRCVDKTSQALREKDPPPTSMVPGSEPESAKTEMISQEEAARLLQEAKESSRKGGDLSGLANATLRQAGLDKKRQEEYASVGQQEQEQEQEQQLDKQRKRKAKQKEDTPFVKPPWWGERIPSISGYYMQQVGSNGQSTSVPAPANKRPKIDDFDSSPLPMPLATDPLQSRRSSIFQFLSGSGIFGRNDAGGSPNANQMEIARNRRSSGLFSFSGTARNSFSGRQSLPNASDLISVEAAAFEGAGNLGNMSNPGLSLNPQQSLAGMNFDPLPFDGMGQEVNHNNNNGQALQQPQHNNYGNNLKRAPPDLGDDALEEMPTVGLMGNSTVEDELVALPPTNRLTTQVSDWLTSFFPTVKDPSMPPQQEATLPPPPGDNLERSISSTIFNMARSPSQFLTTLKSGVTSMVFGTTDDFTPIPVSQPTFGNAPQAGGTSLMGNASTSRPDSLLDDYEETPMETRLRSVAS
jgi:hypothetical protein